MTKKTKMWLAVGGLAAVAGGGVAYYYYNKSKSTTPAALPQGVPVTTFVNGLTYRFAALLPAGITDKTALVNALIAAGWSFPGGGESGIDFFMGAGNKGPFPISDSGYVAHGMWSGPGGTSVPQGVVAVQI